MRKRFDPKFPRKLAGQQAGIHSCAADWAVRDGNRVCALLFKLTRSLHKAADIRASRRVQLDERHAPPLLKPT